MFVGKIRGYSIILIEHFLASRCKCHLFVGKIRGYSIILIEHFLASRYKRHLFVGKIRGYSIVLIEHFLASRYKRHLFVGKIRGYSIVLIEHFLASRYKRHLFVGEIRGYSIVMIELPLSLRIKYCENFIFANVKLHLCDVKKSRLEPTYVNSSVILPFREALIIANFCFDMECCFLHDAKKVEPNVAIVLYEGLFHKVAKADTIYFIKHQQAY